MKNHFLQPGLSVYGLFFHSDSINQSDRVIPDIDESFSSIFAKFNAGNEKTQAVSCSNLITSKKLYHFYVRTVTKKTLHFFE